MFDPVLLAERSRVVADLLGDIRPLVAGDRPARDTLETVLARLEALAARAELFGEAEFAAAARPLRFALGEGADGRPSLALVVLPAGVATSPHAHGTWAAIAAVAGTQAHRLYRRGPEGLEAIDEVVVRPGAGIVLMPEDIHAVRVPGPGPARLLQLHGLALHRAPRQEDAALVEQAWPAARAQAV